MKKVVTAQQVAKKAGVSPTTVSFVMNNVEGANISEATRQRVRKIALEMGYVPHAVAKSLAKGRSDNIGLFLIQPHQQIFADPYIPNIITGLSNAFRSKGFRILVEQHHQPSDARFILTMLSSHEIAGAIITHNMWDQETVSQLANFPVVWLRNEAESGMYCTAIDHLGGVRKIADHLAQIGRLPIGIISYAPEESFGIQARLSAFRDTLATHDISINDTHIRYGAYNPESGYHAMMSLVEDYPEVRAVYCMNDMMAIGALSALHHRGIRIPQDMAIVSYDDIRVSAFQNPPLTTVRAPEVQLGEAAGNMLVKLINGQTPSEKVVLLPTELMIRQSCGIEERKP